MKRPLLIQRLRLPKKLYSTSTPLDIYTALHRLWDYDYMGDGEFTVENANKSIDRILANKEEYIVVVKRIQATYKEETVEKDLWICCNKKDKKLVEHYIDIYADDSRRDHKLKVPAVLGGSLVKNLDIVGWHCIDQDFFFFSDLRMFQNFLTTINDQR